MAEQAERDEFSGTETTGHEWDGIRELDTPLPRWWLWVLYATIVWAIGYWILMPTWPTLNGYTKGLLGYTERARIKDDLAAARESQKGQLSRIEIAPLADIRATPDLLEFALAGGRSAFSVNCSQCHGSGAAGFKGYPNLNDDAWLWGGKLADIEFTVTHGIRSIGDPDTRQSEMPRFLTDEILTAAQVGGVAEYVVSLSGRADAAAAGRGKAIFAQNCVVCHSENGKGKAEFGAPDLTDAIWLYGSDKKSIVESISISRRGVMPAWGKVLDKATIKQIAVYVHSLGGGQ